jgi:hypothetical protein
MRHGIQSVRPYSVRLALLTAALCAVCAAAAGEIAITNIQDGETIRYPIALLRGTAPAATQIEVTNRDNRRPDGTNEAPVVDGKYAILVELVEGANRLTLTAGDETAKLTLTYRPMTTPYKLNVVYVTASDGDTHYETPRSDDDYDFRARLDTAAKLMQTFTAESLNDSGLGRKTFNLDLDENGKVRANVLSYPATAEELRAKSGGDLYGMLYGWIDSRFPASRNKNAVIMAFTQYDREKREARAHTALGGGGMGLFGGATVFAWPKSIREVTSVFSDATPVDPATTCDDSAGRSTIWGLASTCIGAVMHEMGHTFGLPHTNDPYCIMSRGFDHMNRCFTVIEPKSGRSEEPIRFKPEETAHWSPYYAAQLAQHRWFQPDAREFSDENGPRATYDAASETFVFEAPNGLAFYGFNSGPDPVDKTFFNVIKEPKQTEVRVPTADVRAKLGDASPLTIILIDRQGNTMHLSDTRLVHEGEYLREWRISEKPIPWTNRPKSPEVSDAQVKEITADLRSRPVRTFRPRRDTAVLSMDFFDAYRGGENVYAYALATVKAEKETPKQILVGSDDGIRVWLNGELVLEQPGMRADPPDTHKVDVTLTPGDNTILVEVTQGGGGWGFSLRLADR